MTTDGTSIRRAVVTDAGETADVWLESFRAALPTVLLAHDDEEVHAWIRHVLIPEHETWVAVDGDRVVGVMALEESELGQMYVAPGWQGRGLGGRLLELAKERRPDGLELWTFQVNAPARRFPPSGTASPRPNAPTARATGSASRTCGTCGRPERAPSGTVSVRR